MPVNVPRPRLPAWLKVRAPHGERYLWIRKRAAEQNLATVCQEARCPNIGECWQGGTATFMLLGDTCTRGCRFCSVKTHRNPPPPEAAEPQRIAQTIRDMGLDYVVLTTVDRDDLSDQGAAHMAQTIRRAKLASPGLLVEILLPDFMGEVECLQTVVASSPDVLAHNLETVERLTPRVRDPRAGYAQSLAVLEKARQLALDLGATAHRPPARTKSSLMLGLGETEAEVLAAMGHLRQAGVEFLTLGQYLQPDKHRLPVEEFIPPEQFAHLEQAGLEMGFTYVAAGPLVRSSYRAAEYYIAQALRSGDKAAQG